MVGKLTPDNMISASRIPTLLGLSPYSTPNEMLAEMRALDAPFFHDSLPLAASLDGMGKLNATKSSAPAIGLYCPQMPMVRTTGWGCLEAKLTSAPPEDQPPAHRGVWQLQAQMMCTGFEWGCIATLYRGIELRLFVYEADPYMQERIAEAIGDFETRRVTGDKYPVLSSEDGNHAFDHVDDGAPPIDLASIHIDAAKSFAASTLSISITPYNAPTTPLAIMNKNIAVNISARNLCVTLNGW